MTAAPRVLPALATSALILSGTLFAAPSATAQADGETVDHVAIRERSLSVMETQFAAFRDASAALTTASEAFCAGDMARDTYLDSFGTAWRSWAPLEAYQFGPVEQHAAALAVAFWPDKKDYVGRGLEGLLALPADSLADPATIAQGSAAAQGLPAIERLMFSDMAECPAIIGISAHVEGLATALHDDWFTEGGWAELVRDAGPDNPVYRSDEEFTKALFTAINFALTRINDYRLARPLGTFDAPQPTRAEGWRAGLSLDIIDANLAGVAAVLDDGFADAISATLRAEVLARIADTRARIASIGAPLDKAVDDPMIRIRVEGLQSNIRYLLVQFGTEVGPELGVETGFSPSDGD